MNFNKEKSYGSFGDVGIMEIIALVNTVFASVIKSTEIAQI